MGLIDFALIGILIFAAWKISTKTNSNKFLWVLYALAGYILGFIALMVYVSTIHILIEPRLSKDIATASFIVASVVLELSIGLLFLNGIKHIYIKRRHT